MQEYGHVPEKNYWSDVQQKVQVLARFSGLDPIAAGGRVAGLKSLCESQSPQRLKALIG